MNKPKKLVVIDGKSVFYRGYYAMPNLSLADGTPTGGVYGFAVLGLEILKKMQPDYVVVAWDKSKTNIRSRLKLYPEYKANRKPMPDDMRAQIPLVRKLLDAFSWDLLECDDYEADDIMGTLAKQVFEEDGTETIMVTSDLDMLQCVNEHTTVAALKKGLKNVVYFDPKNFRETYKVTAEQFIDIKALKGDASDNIPGVRGVGEKTAIKLIDQYNSLDGVYEHINEQKGALKTKLEADKDMAYLSRKLVTIMLDAPVKLDRKKAAIDNVKPADIKALFDEYRFRSLINQIPQSWQQSDDDIETNSIKTTMQFKKMYSLDDLTDKKTLAMFIHDDEVWVSPNKDTVYLFDPKQLSKLTSLHSVIGHDVKEVLKLFARHAAPMPDVEHDTRVGGFLLNGLLREQDLSSLIGGEVDQSEPTQVLTAIWQLYEQQNKELQQLPKVQKIAQSMEWPIIKVLARMEHEGVFLDTEYLEHMSDKLEDQITDIEQEIYGHADTEFNVNSPGQLADVLYGTLNIPTDFIKKTKSGFSTAASELDKIKDLHPIVALIFKYREWTKLKSTYVDALPKLIDQHSRLHTTYSLSVAATGRLSSHDPNLQNIPIRTELGKTIRHAFKPATGNVFINADYSQFELRLAAALAQEPAMIDAFKKDTDIHQATAAQMYGIPVNEVSKEQRYSAKAVNFGIMYGQGPHGLSQGTGMTMAEAKKFIEKYFEIRPNIKNYIEQIKQQAKDEGFVETWYGRRRPTPDVQSSNFMVREGAYRAAVNMPMQGTAADIMKLAMINIQEYLDQKVTDGTWKMEDAPKMLLQVHDSVLIECREQDAEAVAKKVQEIMENTNTEMPVTFKVDYAIGKTWGEI
ncbi:TPA: DNA polymerase I [Candidatus Saccharibacteria bacterium]|nr:DNA polymerase I [Candidatus Saccharibacteria bacterium]HIO87752.1 DNA polymerase I [Candidatus Saccharibacteria bacterium]